MKTAIVTTTIYVPVLLEAYIKDGLAHDHDCLYVIIGDKKTPPKAKTYCQKLGRRYKQNVVFLDIEDQARYLKAYPELARHLLFNSIQRRNIGMLYAYEHGAEKIITIDDDNYLAGKNFIGMHVVGTDVEMDVIAAKSGWLNVCSFLEDAHKRPFYHRGFPQEIRFQKDQIRTTRKRVKVMVNAGFWLDDPDIDALTRLYYLGQPITVVRSTRKKNFALAPKTWSPFNSQNTALAREVLPAYFLSPYIGRYDDIWAAYVLKKITDHLNHAVSFGNPIVIQKRNPHNYWKDLAKESMGAILTMRFMSVLEKIRLSKKDYAACFTEFTEQFARFMVKEELTEEERAYIEKYIEGMKVWIKTFERLHEGKKRYSNGKVR